jgi:pimeloyl-ACP methyl ester carboxylesterase
MTFVLVHGAYHGPWVWETLRGELEARGHASVAVDLPIEDPTAGHDAYVAAITTVVSDVADPVLVGHSMAGLIVPVAAAEVAVSRIALVCAYLPKPGMTFNAQRAVESMEGRFTGPMEFEDRGDGTWMIGDATARGLFYSGIPESVATAAVARLRPQAYGLFDEVCPLERLPDASWSLIAARDDPAVGFDWAMRAGPSRLGVATTVIEGGHSPMLGRPGELADVLVAFAERPAP